MLAFALAIPVRPDRHAPTPPVIAPLAAQMQGRWQIVQYLAMDRMLPQNTIDNMSLVIEGGEMRVENNGAKKNVSTYTFTIDATKTPATFDFTSMSAKDLSFRGIVKIEGDVMTVCFDHGRGNRPAAFVPPATSKAYLWQARRVR